MLFERQATIEVFDSKGNVRSLREIEKEVIIFALRNTRSKVEAAWRLKIGKSTIYRKIDEFQLQNECKHFPELELQIAS